jgi:hypothetical protein
MKAEVRFHIGVHIAALQRLVGRLVGRAKFGAISIANADSGRAAYTSSAIDQAWRAVNELFV